MESYLGLDFGTSGARVCVVDKVESIIHEDHIFYPDAALQIHLNWREALHTLLKRLPAPIDEPQQIPP